jgi:D-3-phosphoglycerate dehydrogenase
VEHEDLFKDSDIISLHVPLTDETRGMINKDVIDTMKDGVIIINTARGKLINEHDLAQALKSGKVKYAGLDVFESEPPEGSPLLECENILFTPHLGAQTYENMDRIGQQVVEIISAFANKQLTA